MVFYLLFTISFVNFLHEFYILFTFLFFSNYISGAIRRSIFPTSIFPFGYLSQLSFVISWHCFNVSLKSCSTSCNTSLLYIYAPHSKCRYRLLKSRLIVPTQPRISSLTNTLACTKPAYIHKSLHQVFNSCL